MIPLPEFKRGDTFRLSCTYTVDGIASALPAGIAAHVRDARDVLIAQLDVTRVNESGGRYDLSAPESTDAWPLTLLYLDTEFTDAAGNAFRTPTFTLPVIKAITHD